MKTDIFGLPIRKRTGLFGNEIASPPVIQIYTWTSEKVFLGNTFRELEMGTMTAGILETLRRAFSYALVEGEIIGRTWEGELPPSPVSIQEINRFFAGDRAKKGYFGFRVTEVEREHLRSCCRLLSSSITYSPSLRTPGFTWGILTTLRKTFHYTVEDNGMIVNAQPVDAPPARKE
jgi:hypothetical protein